MKRAAVAVAGLMWMAIAPAAWALGKGGSMLAIEVTNGTADLADKTQGGTGYISGYDHSELGVQAQYWRMMAEDYAFTISAGWGFFNETDKPGQGAPAASPDHKFSISSFNVRVGGDRVVKLSERMSLYAGPGIEYWSGNAKFEPGSFAGQTGSEYKGESTTRWSLSGRLGGTMWLSEHVGLTGHVGGRYGYASVEEQGAKASWWPSSMESSVGLLYAFGEK
jgi:hypothetical protein